MPEHSATIYKNNIKYTVYAAGLPLLGAGLSHLRTRNIRFIADLSIVKDMSYIVDVGANMGYLSMQYHFAFPNAHILAIEPSSYNLKYLRKNTEHIDNIEILQVAAARDTCELEIAMPTPVQRGDIRLGMEDWDNTGALSIFGEGDLHREKVKGVRLDDVVSQKVDYLKLDIEGSELEALLGAHRILTEDRPVIQIEMRPQNLAMAGTNAHEVHELILGHGYMRIGKHAGDSLYCHSSINYSAVADYKLRQEYSAPDELLFQRFKSYLTRKDVDFLRQIDKVKTIKNIYDVGACIGVLSLLFVATFGDVVVHAIEPSSVNFTYLITNTETEPRIFCENVALSNKDGTINIAMPTQEQRPEMTEETSKSSALISVYGESDLYSEEVTARKLDSTAMKKVDLIKIDAEGHEWEVLEGAERILMEDRPIVFLNLRKGTQRMAGRTRLDLRKKIGSYGYKRVGHYRGDAIYFPEELELPEGVPMEMQA
jgi:FkbM family methyltransferase